MESKTTRENSMKSEKISSESIYATGEFDELYDMEKKKEFYDLYFRLMLYIRNTGAKNQIFLR